MSIRLSEDNHDSWGTCTTSAECKTVITVVLTVMSGMDPHMIGVGFAIVHDDVSYRLIMPWETSISHGASKRLWARPFGTDVASMAIITAPMVQVSCALLGLCIIIPWAVLSVYLRLRLSA
jgi:hypothetical protein